MGYFWEYDFDSGNDIAQQTINTPNFNAGDGRSDDRGAEPELVSVLNIADERYILFVGLERNDQTLVYDITNPSAPEFLQLLSRVDDESPEWLLIIPSEDNPNNRDLLLISNEDSGTLTIYENIQ